MFLNHLDFHLRGRLIGSVMMVLCLWYLWQRVSVKLIATTALILFGSMLLTILIDRTYHYMKHGFFFLWKFITYTGFGSIPVFLFFLILLLAIPFKIVMEKIRDPGLPAIFVVITAIITFLNAATIAACNPMLPPYFCYSQFTLYCLAGLLASRVFTQRYNNLLEVTH